MRVSQKMDYALRAMLELAQRQKAPTQPDGAPVSVRTADIARNKQIPEKFLETILVDLRRAGLIASQRGPVGGHRLSRPAAEISAGDVWRAIEGGLGEPGNQSTNGGQGKNGGPFGFLWHDIEEAIAEVVDGITLAEIVARAVENTAVQDYAI